MPSLPLPVAALIRRSHNAKSIKDRHDAAYYAWEASVRLTASIRGHLGGDFCPKPSISHWVAACDAPDRPTKEEAILRVHRLMAKVGTGRESTPERTSMRRVLELLPAYRNNVIGHGSIRSSEFYRKAGAILAKRRWVIAQRNEP